MDRPPLFAAQRIAGVYILFGVLWIIGSDRLVEMMVPDLRALTLVQTYKGWAFVLASGLLIFLVLNRELKARAAAEDTLRASEERYRLVFTMERDAIALVDPETSQFVDINEAAVRLWGYTREELLAMSALDVSAEPEKSSASIQLAVEGQGHDVPIRWHKKKNGTAFPVAISVGSVLWNGRSLVCAIARDISEQFRTEEALRDSEERFRNVFEQGPLGMAILDLDYRWVSANPKLCEMLGYTKDELTKLTFVDIIHPDDAEPDLEQAKRLLSGEIPSYKMEKRYVKKSGEVIWIHLSGSVVRDDRGEPHYFLAMIEDITQRKAVEEALSKSESMLRNILSTSPVGIVGLTADRAVAWVNDAGLEMFGFETEEEVVGRSAAIVYPSDAEYDRVGRALYEGLRTQPTSSVDAALKRKDGTIFDGHIRMKALGTPDLAIAAISDISERKRTEELLKESEARIRTKLDSILLPDGDIGTLELADVVDVPAFQAIMDHFFSLTKLPLGLIDLNGKVLVATGWQEICAKFHRAHPETCQHCIESDTLLSRGAKPGSFKLYRCNNNMWDMATPIVVGGKHLGNLFLGQFLFEDEKLDYDAFRSQARRYGFDEHEYLAALEKVPRFTRETVDRAMAFYAKLANMLSALSYSNIKLARSLAEQERLINSLRESEQRYRAVVDNIEIGISVLNPDMQIIEVNKAFKKYFPDVQPATGQICYEEYNDPPRSEPCPYCPAVLTLQDGKVHEAITDTPAGVGIRHYHLISSPIKDSKGQIRYVIELTQDITDRKKAEDDRLAHLRFFESMDRVNLAMQATKGLEQMMGNVLDALLSIFDCDRAWLLYPCDPEAVSWRVPMERTRPEYPGAYALGLEVPMDPEAAKAIRTLLATNGPVTFGPGSEHPLPAQVAKQFSEQSQIAMAIYPKGQKPYIFGLHQCSYPRIWTSEEKRLFQEVGRRLSDGLTSLIAHRDMEKSEHMLRTILATSPVGVALIRTRRIEWTNEAWKEMFGFGKEQDYLGQNTRILYASEEEYHRAGKALYQGLDTGKNGETDAVLKRKDGSIFDAHVKTQALDPLDLAKGIISVISDISSRRRAEEALKAASAYNRSLIEASLDPLVTISAHGKITDVNMATERVTGYSRGELVGMDFADYFDDPRKAKEGYRRAYKEGAVTNYELQIRHRDGHLTPVMYNASVYRDSSDNIVGLFAAARDVSLLKAVEEKNLGLAAIVESSDDAIIGKTLDGIITSWNQGAANIYGYNETEAVGKPITLLAPTDRRDEVFRLLEKIEQGEHVKHYETVRMKKNGRRIEVSLTISPIRNIEGRIVGASTIARDITDQKTLQRQLQQAQKLEAVGTLAGGIAHDFNNLLQVTLGYSDLLLAEKREDDPEYADLSKILQAATSGAELVRRLLTFSRKVELKPIPLNLNRQIIQVEKILRRTIPKMIDIQIDLSNDLAKILADPTQMEQVLMNLALNARDAIPDKGTLSVSTRNINLDEEYCGIHAEAKPGEYVLLSVSDTGQGMDKRTIEHIFEPFYTTKELGRGTGLGLAVVYGIVKQHGGYITCYSEVGHGTSFHVYFPAIETRVEPNVETTEVMPAFGTEMVLLVDDEDFVRDLGERILSKAGYKVLTAANGKEALDLFQKERTGISLVILDLIMPEMGGTECLRELKKIDPHLNVLIASGLAADPSLIESRELGASGFVSKPFKMRELLRQVRKALDHD